MAAVGGNDRILAYGLFGAVVTVLYGVMCVTTTPPMHHTMYQIASKNDKVTLHGPGVHFQPLPRPLCRAIHVKTALDIDRVNNIRVGASDGTELVFNTIEVGNKPHAPMDIINLVDRYGEDWEWTVLYDQVHYLMSTICSKMTSHEIAIEKFDQLDDLLMDGLRTIQTKLDTRVDIVNVRVYKPTLPPALAAAYAAQAEQKALHKVEVEKNAKIAQENTNAMLVSKGQHDREAAAHANRVSMERAAHDSTMAMDRERADAEAYAAERRAEANARLHTPAYLELKRSEALLANAKIITGDAANALFANMLHFNNDIHNKDDMNST